MTHVMTKHLVLLSVQVRRWQRRKEGEEVELVGLILVVLVVHSCFNSLADKSFLNSKSPNPSIIIPPTQRLLS